MEESENVTGIHRTRKGVIARKKSLRDYHADKIRREGLQKMPAVPRNGALATKPRPMRQDENGGLKRSKAGLKRTPLRKVSANQRHRNDKYFKMRAAFLSEPGNALCRICIVRQEKGEVISVNRATEIHHFSGRQGKNLFRGFIPSCFWCRMWPHDNIAKAQEFGLISRRSTTYGPDFSLQSEKLRR